MSDENSRKSSFSEEPGDCYVELSVTLEFIESTRKAESTVYSEYDFSAEVPVFPDLPSESATERKQSYLQAKKLREYEIAAISGCRETYPVLDYSTSVSSPSQ
mmetsp:Transcript_4915/g.9205  ORF Transcript_4915/g.9205 Transcript_4915/m.9205 type:complete len:103 (-) Transcript_4915:1763-2071(-)